MPTDSKDKNELQPGIPVKVSDDEYLYRGVISKNWSKKHNRVSSAAFKDSKGASVDRDNFRAEEKCVDRLLNSGKNFVAVCKVKTKEVRAIDAIVIYEPLQENIYHSEIHDSEEQAQLKGSKPKNILKKSETVHQDSSL